MTDWCREQAEFLSTRDQVPHVYQETVPYTGCADCGQGPGALQHNTELVLDYLTGDGDVPS